MFGSKARRLAAMGIVLLYSGGPAASPEVSEIISESKPIEVSLFTTDPFETELAKPEAEYVHHLVLVELKADVTDGQQQEIVDQALSLLGDIPGVEEVHVGHKLLENREVHIKNYDIAIYIRLQNSDSIKAYRAHENHRVFLKTNKDKFAWIQVVDFIGKTTIDFSSRVPTIESGEKPVKEAPEPASTTLIDQ